ncbi:IS5/IS1182 family transposase, partial [Helcococcus ovis]
VEKILYLNNQYLLENDFLDASSIYIDGTKIEANSNKYIFVWKKSIIKFKNNLLEKIAKYLKISDFSDEKLIIKALKEEKQKLRDIIKFL